MKKHLYLLCLIFILLVFFAGTYIYNEKPHAPNILYKSIQGQSISFSHQNYIVEFWATDCPTCLKTLPSWMRLIKEENIPIIQVAMSYDKLDYIKNYIKSYSMSSNIVFDKTGKIAHDFGDVTLTPTIFLINKNNQIVKKYMGEPDFKKVKQDIENLK